MEVAPAIGGALMKATGTQAFNIIQNNGKIAGQEGTVITLVFSQPTPNALLTPADNSVPRAFPRRAAIRWRRHVRLLVQVASSITGQP